MTDRERQKQNAAAAAAALVEPGMLVGLGSGSTATQAIRLLGQRHRDGLRFTGVPTSRASADLAATLGIRLVEAPDGTPIDLTIDGADEIAEADLALIKGMGGALLREKIVAASSRRLVIVGDATKLKPRLTGDVAIPVEVAAFGWAATRERLRELGCQPVLRRDQRGDPFHTDGDNLILDCAFAALPDPAAIERELSMIVGVLETGLFIGLATTALVASDAGVRRIDR